MTALRENILVVDDDPDILLTTRVILKKHFKSILTETDPSKVRDLLSGGTFELILLDMNFRLGETSGREGISLLRKILKSDPEATVVLMTAYGDIDLAVEAMKVGATDFIVKPWNNKRLLATIDNALRIKENNREIRRLKSKEDLLIRDIDQHYPNIIGHSEPMKKIYELIRKVGPTDASVLILGENGTGKELVARAIHRSSDRSDQIFVPVDLGALPETLFESELFGHVKGAFTDAREDRPGRFELAAGGTLFLDEIGNLSRSMQAKLLTAVQNHSITPVGASREIPVDIRLVSATNLSREEISSGAHFREDLLYRINTVEIRIPPLRHRGEDIPLLADHFIRVMSKKYNKPGVRLSKDSYRKLSGYNWPGNVRELQHVIERAVIMTDTGMLTPADFLLQREEDPASHNSSLRMEDVEKQAIVKALKQNGNNISKSADELGMARTTLYRKMRKYEL